MRHGQTQFRLAQSEAKEGDAFLPHEVEIATATNTQVAIVSGLEEGQQVSLQPVALHPASN